MNSRDTLASLLKNGFHVMAAGKQTLASEAMLKQT